MRRKLQRKLFRCILKTLALYSDRSGYNRVAELLADENDYHGIDIIRFGKDINVLLERKIIENTSVIQQYMDAIDLYRRNYQHEVIEGVDRKVIERIPENAYREVLANGIVHRDWGLHTAIRIGFFEDRIEITSPGGLPSGISKEEYLNGQVSILRNPILGNVFFRLGYIERFGTGIKRTLQAYHGSVRKPEFSIFQNSISVILPLYSKDPGSLDKEERAIFDLLQNETELSRTEIENKLQMNKDKAIRTLNELIGKKIVIKTGRGRGTKYTLP